jgi:hypothetical protein
MNMWRMRFFLMQLWLVAVCLLLALWNSTPLNQLVQRLWILFKYALAYSGADWVAAKQQECTPRWLCRCMQDMLFSISNSSRSSFASTLSRLCINFDTIFMPGVDHWDSAGCQMTEEFPPFVIQCRNIAKWLWKRSQWKYSIVQHSRAPWSSSSDESQLK